MQIQLKLIKEEIGAVLPFSCKMDISDLEPCVKDPIEVAGQVRNRAGVLLLEMEMSGVLSVLCDRCAKEFRRDLTVCYETAVADHIMGEESDDILVCENDVLDLDELASQIFILDIPSKNLCSEDCKGLCSKCGADLNESTCNCAHEEIDPRLMKLRQLLDE